MRVGWFKPAHPKTAESHRLRSTLLARKRLVDIRRHMENQLRNIIKTAGAVLGSTAGRGLLKKVEAACEKDPTLDLICRPVMVVIETVRAHAAEYDRLLRSMGRRDEIARRMMTVPGVGVMTALAFMSTIDDPHRFKRSSDVGAVLGLTPQRHQSGEMDWSGRISKQGDGLVRTYLYEAASVLISKITRWSKFKAWGVRLAKTSGHGKARIAVARKIAVILHCIWIDGTEFEWTDPAAA